MIFAAAGIIFSLYISRKRFSLRLIAYVLPMSFLGIMLLAKSGLIPNGFNIFYDIFAGRSRFILLTFVITMGIMIPAPYLKYRIEKVITFFIMICFVIYFCIMPFLYPAILQSEISSLNGWIDENGVCHQSTDYTCGPAAAVTALGSLGLPAQEGRIAVLSRSCPLTGTLPKALCNAISELYSNEVICRWEHTISVEKIREEGTILLAVMKDSFMNDHCVAVLEVDDRYVTIADPSLGLQKITCQMFTDNWRRCGITLKKTLPAM